MRPTPFRVLASLTVVGGGDGVPDRLQQLRWQHAKLRPCLAPVLRCLRAHLCMSLSFWPTTGPHCSDGSVGVSGSLRQMRPNPEGKLRTSCQTTRWLAEPIQKRRARPHLRLSAKTLLKKIWARSARAARILMLWRAIVKSQSRPQLPQVRLVNATERALIQTHSQQHLARAWSMPLAVAMQSPVTGHLSRWRGAWEPSLGTSSRSTLKGGSEFLPP
mmetsp:Transcript_695/g.2788  ORF Transcript_695/g.2788 Transcript_695/m.2788 type:complete len:217 (+) Transcript_695:643-1293(+)